MKYLYHLAILFIALPLLSNAQSNYKPGYIVTAKGDTLRGLIDYQDWEGSPKLFRFKANSTANAQRFTAINTSYVEISQLDAYQKYQINISTDITDIQHLETFRDTSFRTDTVFLKILQKGKNIVLYSFTDHLKTRFFVKETASEKPPYELIYKIYKRDFKTFNDNTYVKQLFDLAAEFKNDNEVAATSIEHAEYKKEDILKAASAINNISPAEYKLKYEDKTRVLFFAGTGASLATFQLSSVQASSKLNNTSVMPMITAGIDIIANPATSRFFFRVEAAITQDKFKEAFPNATSPYYPLDYSFSLIGVSIIPQFVYNAYNTENFKLYLSPGVQIAFLSEKDAHYNQINGGTITPIDPLLVFNTVAATVALKAGAKINKRFDISGSYQLPTTLTRARNGKIDLNSIFIGVNYYFGKN
ncbi:hypothetical protein [Mucilaginibacter polytrichastri]|uniref:Outer membrane protein beta-barrel domain-containing protein n=1 Tax=Mucilaginibacter polytrichastri TaxID=1302689 RepID=A0A1Q6A1V5_9SPHI|nr:hypothetical protein [Mucilaginibacter polytrichastri]OKS87999.1 hypothetical protein RG47T_3463 [Mucilaginibacter polytrichastri]